MKRIWVHHSTHNGYEIQKIDPPRKHLRNWRCQHPYSKRFIQRRTLDDCKTLIDAYAPYHTNTSQRDAAAKGYLVAIGFVEPYDKPSECTGTMLHRGWRWNGKKWV